MSKRQTSTKTILALLIAAIMMFALSVPVMASGLPPATGTLHIHKYAGAETTPNDGTPLDQAPEGTPLNGVVFDIYIVDAPITNNPTYPDVPPVGTYLLNPQSGNLEVYSGSTKVAEYKVTFVKAVTTAGQGTATTVLDQGLYLVVENTEDSAGHITDPDGEPMFISTKCPPFLEAVPMTNPNGDGWLDEVHVYPKNEALSIDKIVDVNDAVMVGDIVSYSITASVPGDIATSKQYDIIDVLDPALTYQSTTLAVSTITPVTLVSGTDYTANYDSTSRKLLVSFSNAGRVKLDGLQSVVVEFDCKVNDTILSYVDYTVSNQAQVEFTNADDVEFDAESGNTDADIHTAAIEITKYDENGAPLGFAEFKIATSLDNAQKGQFLRQDPTTKQLFDYGTTEWSNLGSPNDYKVVTDESTGKATFKGLRNTIGGINQKYFIVETKAPAGYNLLSAPEEAEFNSSVTQVYNWTYAMNVINSKGFTLPKTGGMGTIIWTVAGIALIGSAIMVLVSKKKKSENS